MKECFGEYPTEVIAMVLLPEHLHALWALPSGDSNYSIRWSYTKGRFTNAWLASGGREPASPAMGTKEGRRGVWQRRFWEHTIRDESDLEAHFDYIHYNPVKHGLVDSPRDWPWSTFHRWVSAGHYQPHWGRGVQLPQLPGNAGE
jgi:putative transposase